MKNACGILCLMVILLPSQVGHAGDPGLHDGWRAMTPREELRPEISWEADAGPNHKGAFVDRKSVV